MDIKQLKLPEPGHSVEVPDAPKGWTALVKAITTKRYQVKLVKRPPDAKKR